MNKKVAPFEIRPYLINIRDRVAIREFRARTYGRDPRSAECLSTRPNSSEFRLLERLFRGTAENFFRIKFLKSLP